MNKTERVLLYATALLVLISTAYVVKQLTTKNKIVYVDIGKLLEGYQLKKDLEAEGMDKLQTIKNANDSVRMIQKVNGSPELKAKAATGDAILKAFSTTYPEEVSRKVWERLNPLLEQFGKEKQLELVIGANGAGTVLYGGKQSDITEEAINYVNEHYRKGN